MEPAIFDQMAERLIDDVIAIDQDSARWTVAQLIGENLQQWQKMPAAFRAKTLERLFALFGQTNDWIVTIQAIKTLTSIAISNAPEPKGTAARLRPVIEPILADPRRSVSNAARKAQTALDIGKPL